MDRECCLVFCYQLNPSLPVDSPLHYKRVQKDYSSGRTVNKRSERKAFGRPYWYLKPETHWLQNSKYLRQDKSGRHSVGEDARGTSDRFPQRIRSNCLLQ